jgi:SAM-dependent methyltransferase
MALRVHGTLKPDALRYTRRVTLAWTVLFALIAAALVILFFAAPLTVWSAFSNFGAPLAIIAMFAAEHLVRYRALPDMPHSGLIKTLRASAAVGFGSARASPLTAEQLLNTLARSAAGCYRPSGLWAYFFARCKLKFDPFYSVLLAKGLIPPGMRILDLGCAQGLLAAWLMAAQRMHAAGVWDRASPEPVAISGYRGVDRNAAEIRRAQLALGDRAEFAVGDFARAPLRDATLVLLIDVLHYLDYGTQVELLRRIRNTLPAHGLVLLRVGDSDGSLRARASVWVDWLVMRLRGGKSALSRRPISAWIALLNEIGYTVQEVARQSAPGYINCLLRAQPAPSG